jgi:nitroreductase
MAAARSLVQIIRDRHSVRAYSGEAIPASAFTELVAACGSLTRGPLGTECRIRLVEDVWSVWGTRLFLAGAARGGPHALVDLGRLLQELVLRASGLGLSTCWIGLGFPQQAFAGALTPALAPGEILPAVIAVGLPSGRKTAYGLAARLATGASRRKPWGELFFDGDFRTPLPEPPAEVDGPYALALEMVRLAPSAQNRQPWRIVRDGPEVKPAGGDRPRFHFFRQQPAGLLTSRPDWLRLDIGIAMAHFELTLAEAGVRGRWSAIGPDRAADAGGLPGPLAPGPGHAAGAGGLPPRTEYVASWLPEDRP